MALKDCFKKFGKALSEKDKAAITQMVADGMGEQEAVDTYVEQLKAQIEVLEKNLLVTHNLSEENLKHVLDLGGLAAPSLAIQAADKGFNSFGEITLIGDPSMISDKSIKFFDSDIYSPRQPRAQYKLDYKKFNDLMKEMGDVKGLDRPDFQSLEDRGVDGFKRSNAAMYHYLVQNNSAPKITKKKAPAGIKESMKYVQDKYQGTVAYYELARDEDFIALQKARYKKMALDRELPEDYFLDEDGDLSRMTLETAASEAIDFAKGGIDTYKLRNDIDKKMRDKKVREGFEKYADETFNDLVIKKQMYTGTDSQGRPKYKDYTLDNVVRNMIKDLRGGEGFNYGVGNIRAGIAKKISSIDAAKKQRGKIVSNKEFEKIKEQSNDKFWKLLETIKPKYKFDKDSYRYSDDASDVIFQYAMGKGKLSEAFEDGIREDVDAFLEYLGDLPTEYFEGKAQRAMQLSEFKAAVVPSDVKPETIQALKDAGLEIITYDGNLGEAERIEDRKKSVIEAGKKTQTLFQEDKTEYQEIKQGDATVVETGKPVKFNYVHNKKSYTKENGKPDIDSQFYRGYEPSGKFVNIFDGEKETTKQFEYGSLQFKNPLVVDNDGLKWKKTLSKKYKGLTGKELSKAIIADGYDGIITKEGDKYISEVVDLTSFDATKAIYQNGDAEPRGSLSILLDGSRVLKRSHKGDKSTIPHELAHLFLEVEKDLERDFGRTENQAALLSWLNVRNFNEITTEHHEKFAETFEVYLQEGKAPSPELRETFSKFRTWISNVYKDLIKDPRFRADLSDESRYIFDRMFATEEQIESMRETPAYSILFRSKEQAGMTDEQYAEYLKNPDKVKSRAQTRIDKTIMDQLRKIKSKEWAEEKSFIIEEELERLKETKIYLTIETLKTHPLHLETLRESLGIPAPKRGEDKFIPEPTDSILTLAAKMGGLDMGQFSGQGKPEDVKALGNEVRELMRKVESTDTSKPQSLEKWIGHTPKSLQSFIISMGGFNIQKSPEMVAELKARDIKIPSLLTHPKQGELTHGVDDILLAVVDNGYFKATDDTGRISMSELVDAIERSVNEEPIYTMEDNDAINNSYREAQKEYEYYAEKGLNSKSTNQDIALAVNAKGSEDEIDVEILKDKEKNNRFVGKPVFRKDSGMGKAEFVKLLDEHGFGYFINEGNVAYAIKAELEGQSIISPEGQAILDQRERDLIEKGSSLERAKFIEKYVKKHGREDGADPELIAEWAGYRDVREMIEDVAFAAPIKQQAEKNAEQIMVAKYGDILNDDTIEEEVRAALENEEQAKLLLAEIKALGRKVGKPDRINREELKAKAKELIGTMKNSEIKPNKFYRAAMKAAERAGKAQSEEEQIQAKIQQLANHYLYKEALTAKEKLDRQSSYVKKMQTKKWRTTEVGGDYRRIIGLVSNMYDAKKEPMDDVMSALSWFNTQVENEAGVYANVLDHNLLAVLEQQVLAREKGEQFNPSGYQFPKLADLTVDEMQGLYEQLKHLRWIGGKLAEGQNAIDALERAKFAESIAKNGGKDFKDDKGIPDKYQSDKRDFRHFLYKNISLLNMVRKLDNDFKNDNGMAFEKIFMDIQSANSKKIALHTEIYNLMKDELKDIYKLGLDRKKVDYPLENGGTIPLGSEHRFMLAMYWGTESSREAIIKGFENTYGLTENDVMNILRTMSPDELATVNKMWKINEHFWPRLRETVIAHEGVAPVKLEPTPFEINGVQMTGGHQMLKYDSMDIDVKQESEKASTSSKIMPSKSGSAHSRIGSGGRPVLLELGNITRAMDDNIHYIAFADTGARLRSLLNAKEVKAEIEKKHGVGFHKALVEQVDSISGNKQLSGEIRGLTKMLRHLRGAATARHLMYSVRNTVQQSSAIPIAMQEVGSAEFISSVMKFSTQEGRQQNIEFIDSLSPYMAERASLVNREAAENVRKLSFENTKMKKAWQSYLDYGFMPQTFVDSLIAYPVWLARYDQAMNEHGDQKKAIVQADNSVSESVGSGSDLYLGGFFQASNTESIKAFTVFGSFFNMYLQRIYRDTEGMSKAQSKEVFYTMVSTPLIVSVLSAAVIMDLPDDESDDEEWLAWMAKQYAKFMGGTVIFVRDIMSFGLGGFTPKTTFAGLIESGGVFAGNVIPSLFDPDTERTGAENLSDSIKFAASLFKLPASGNVTRVLDYVESSEKGNEETESEFIRPYQAIVEGSNKN